MEEPVGLAHHTTHTYEATTSTLQGLSYAPTGPNVNDHRLVTVQHSMKRLRSLHVGFVGGSA